MIPDYNSTLTLANGSEVGVARYSLSNGAIWTGEIPNSRIRSDVSQSNTGEIILNDGEGGEEKTCRILHSISPIQGARILWADCTATNVTEGVLAERSFELLRLIN